jgi:hypothetical protein
MSAFPGWKAVRAVRASQCLLIAGSPADRDNADKSGHLMHCLILYGPKFATVPPSADVAVM